jgi:hypothetical protein
MNSSMLTLQNPGHIRVCMKPGPIQFDLWLRPSKPSSEGPGSSQGSFNVRSNLFSRSNGELLRSLRVEKPDSRFRVNEELQSSC